MNKPMIIEDANFVQHFTIGDAWRDIMYLCVKKGYDYKIEQGSYEGQLRKQLAFATLRIIEPWTRPLAPIMPPGMPPPTDDEAIEKYFMKYIIEDKLEKNEQYCYDDKTEILTDKGWKLFKDLDKTELVATINPANLEIEYQKPDDYHCSSFEGEMIRIKSRSVDLLVNPEHKLLINKLNNKNEFVLCPVNELEVKNFRMFKSGIWNPTNSEPENFILPKVKYENYRYTSYGAEREIPMNDWLAFFGIWLAEGSLRTGDQYTIVISQKNEINKNLILEKIKTIFPNVNHYGKDIYFNDKQVYLYLQQFGKCGDKFIPDELLNLPSDQLKILLEWMYLGDGHNIKNSNLLEKFDSSGGRRLYSSNSRKLVDQIQEICLKIGWSADVRGKEKNTYRLSIHEPSYSSPHINVDKHIFKEYYNGNIYCVHVPNHNTLYVRRNGKTVWCGNTYGSYIKPQINRIIEILNVSNGNSNQACISVGDRDACNLEDPPCLRNITFKVVDGKLNMTVFFRSWDLYAGMPENLGGLQMFKEYILAHLNFPCEDGPITAYSDGLHIYEQYIDVINCLSASKMTFKKSEQLNLF